MEGRAARDWDLPRTAKAALLLLALGGLLAVVAVASRSGHPGGSAHAVPRSMPGRVANDLLTLVVVVYALAVGALLIAAFHRRDKWKPPRYRWWRDLVTIAILFALIGLLGFRAIVTSHLRRHASHPPSRQAGPGRRPGTSLLESRRSRHTKPAQFDWVLVAVLGGLTLGGIAVYAIRSRRVPAPAQPVDVAEELSDVLDDAIDDLRAEADPRRAVIAAYARMERVLGAHGLPRRSFEAPFEYLARVLLDLRVRPGGVQALTELFERAKFSRHEIDRSMKDSSIAALLSVREDLQAAAAAAAEAAATAAAVRAA